MLNGICRKNMNEDDNIIQLCSMNNILVIFISDVFFHMFNGGCFTFIMYHAV